MIAEAGLAALWLAAGLAAYQFVLMLLALKSAVDVARPMRAVAVAQGAHPETLQGLAGLSDLIATSQSPLSRNNTAGRLLGQGYRFDDVVKQMNQTAEGLASVAPILQLAKQAGVSMPIVEQVKRVLDGTMNPREIAPHLTTDDDTPQGERTEYGQAGSGGALRRAVERTLDQFRHGGRRPPGD